MLYIDSLGSVMLQVSSIKSGLWNSIYDSFQAIGNNELDDSHANKDSEYETIDVGAGVEMVPVMTKDDSENKNCEFICLKKKALAE